MAHGDKKLQKIGNVATLGEGDTATNDPKLSDLIAGQPEVDFEIVEGKITKDFEGGSVTFHENHLRTVTCSNCGRVCTDLIIECPGCGHSQIKE